MNDAGVWTAELVRERLREACATLRRAATSVRQRGPSTRVTAWADAPHAAAEAYGYTPEAAPRVAPDRGALGRMDEVLAWVARWCSLDACRRAGLPPDAGWLALKRADGWAWPKIARHREAVWRAAHGDVVPGGNSRTSLAGIERRCHAYLAERLTAAGVPTIPAADDESVVRGLDPGPGALPRVMSAVEPVQNVLPCGSCARFKPKGAHGARFLCTRFNVQVSPLYRAYAAPGEPCWVAPAPPA